jgi:uncharacterized delta-60 repeat protein
VSQFEGLTGGGLGRIIVLIIQMFVGTDMPGCSGRIRALDTSDKGAEMNARRFLTCAWLTSTFGMALTLVAAPLALAAPGDLDPSFDGDGKVITDSGHNNDSGNAMALDDLGHIIVAGNSYSPNTGRSSFALVRYNSNGSLDTTFDGDGKVQTDIGDSSGAQAVALDSVGRIVAVGWSHGDLAVARYRSDGSLDTAFNSDGKVTISFGATSAPCQGLALDSGGRMVVAGFGAGDFTVTRLLADGTLDTTFGADGLVTTDFGGRDDRGYAVALDQTGRIVVVGFASDIFGPPYDLAVARYNADGSLDTTFSDDGKTRESFGVYGSAYDVAIDRDGRIVVAGYGGPYANEDFALARYRPDGSLDTTFDGDGKVTTDFGGFNDEGKAVELDGAGRILVAGQTYAYADDEGSWGTDFAVVRYNPDGSLDTSYGENGKVTTNLGGVYYDEVRAAGLDVFGRLVAVGTTDTRASGYDFAVVRYLGDRTYLPLALR